MNNIANTTRQELSRLDSLAMQAQMCVHSARMNLLELGRVLTEAKPLVPHGEWDAWIQANTDMSRRTAEQYMQAYAEFGLDYRIAKLGTTKALKLLPLPAGEREEFLNANDVAAMSTRQVEEAVARQREALRKEAMAEAEEEIAREREARIAAEQKAEEAQKKQGGADKRLAEKLRLAEGRAEDQERELERLSRDLGESNKERTRLTAQVATMKQEIRERDELLEEQQEGYNRMQDELLSAKSAIAKGEPQQAEASQLTEEAFAQAVQAFIGKCARLPHMGAVFAGMGQAEKAGFDELLRTVEGWARDSRRALDAVAVDAGREVAYAV